MTKQERWKDIRGYEGLYQVSDLGKVKTLRKNKILKPGKAGKGYLFVSLVKNSVREKRYVHRLVLETFNPREDMDIKINGRSFLNVDHINNIKTDNRLENLQWLTPKQNTRKELDKTLFKRKLYKFIKEVE